MPDKINSILHLELRALPFLCNSTSLASSDLSSTVSSLSLAFKFFKSLSTVLAELTYQKCQLNRDTFDNEKLTFNEYEPSVAKSLVTLKETVSINYYSQPQGHYIADTIGEYKN